MREMRRIFKPIVVVVDDVELIGQEMVVVKSQEVCYIEMRFGAS